MTEHKDANGMVAKTYTGEMGGHLVVRAARPWRSIPDIDGRSFKVTVVGNEADEHVGVLNERFPRPGGDCDIVARRMELDSAERETDLSMVGWEELPESLRESNRHQAADISRKLLPIGCDIEPSPEPSGRCASSG